MLHEAEKKAGVPVKQRTLLDYATGGGSPDTLLDLMQENTVNTANRSKYEKQEKAADELGLQVQKFLAEGSDSLFAKAKESGDTSDLCKEIETLAEKYNSLLSQTARETDTMNVFYGQSMKELVTKNKDALAGIGVTVNSDGSLKVDQEKLQSASLESLEKAFGRENVFVSNLAYVVSRVEGNASANLESISGSYASNGNFASMYTSKYDFWS